MGLFSLKTALTSSTSRGDQNAFLFNIVLGVVGVLAGIAFRRTFSDGYKSNCHNNVLIDVAVNRHTNVGAWNRTCWREDQYYRNGLDQNRIGPDCWIFSDLLHFFFKSFLLFKYYLNGRQGEPTVWFLNNWKLYFFSFIPDVIMTKINVW